MEEISICMFIKIIRIYYLYGYYVQKYNMLCE